MKTRRRRATRGRSEARPAQRPGRRNAPAPSRRRAPQPLLPTPCQAARVGAGLSFTVAGWMAYLVHATAAVAASAMIAAKRRGRAGYPLQVLEIATGIGVACALLALTSGPVLIDFYKAYFYA